MMYKTAIFAISGLAAFTEASAIKRTPAKAAVANKAAASSASTCLSANALQTGSFVTGQLNDVPSGGQSNSETDTANFINFCAGQTLTNGLQVKTGSCNGIVMGKIPATTNMVSTVITNPKLNDNLDENTTFNVTVNIANMQLGSFTNATSTYYAAPQDLDSTGRIIGHTHVTIQSVGDSFQFDSPLDATKFAFFKGINDAGNGQGTLTTAVTGGLPAGNYRVCTMSSSSNHQPVLMPVAQRGAQDDCRYFTVGASSSSTSTSSSSGSDSSSVAVAAVETTAAAAGTSTVFSTTATTSITTATAAAAAATTAASTSSSSSAIGGIEAPAVQDSGDSSRPFLVNGDTFVNKSAAVQRACAIQNNACADAVNGGKVSGFTVGDCNAQEVTCNSA